MTREFAPASDPGEHRISRCSATSERALTARLLIPKVTHGCGPVLVRSRTVLARATTVPPTGD
jgi:hypothetical protein